MTDDAHVTHDAASLYRFIETISVFCDLQKSYPAYLESSREFLKFIGQLAGATKLYLSDFPSRLPADIADYPVYRQELSTLRDAWYEIHRRVKPIADADTLHLPSPLIKSLTRRLRGVPGLSNVRLAVLHIERLNYLQVVTRGIRDITAQISALVGASPYPPNLGLIGIPYSQAESAFLNCLITHEIGHFVFAELQINNSLLVKVRDIFNSVFRPIASTVSISDWRPIAAVFAGWVEELFCDLFAIRFVGPCYSFAFVEIFDLPNVLHRDGAFNAPAATAWLEFSDSHPAFLYRLTKQFDMPRQLGWWSEINSSQSNVNKVLDHAARLKITDFSVTFLTMIQQPLLDALDQSVPEVVNAVENLLSALDPGLSEYTQLKGAVRDYFQHGVVPSTLADSSSGNSRSPSPVTILNVAYQFYLDNLPELMNRILEQDSNSVEHRTKWAQRLEAWTLKALDDLELISTQPGNS